VASGYLEWLAARQVKAKFPGYDPDATFGELETRLARGERFPLAEQR
jgi:hypothetical protein